MDQIPPGNPKTWATAGVPTVAKYKEPGDVVPMFNQTMFKRTDTGALAMAAYYLQARDWALAVVSPVPFTIVCDADACSRARQFIEAKRKIGQHVEGQRFVLGAPKLLPAPSDLSPRADYVVQLKIRVKAGQLVDNSGTVIEKAPAVDQRTNLYMRWSGKIWRVVGDFLVSS